MKKYLLLFHILVLFVLSCKNKTTTNSLVVSESTSQQIDSLKKSYNVYFYTFNEENFIYNDLSLKKITDTLQLMQKVYVDSTIYDSLYSNTKLKITYTNGNTILKGYIKAENISKFHLQSSKDSTIIFLLGYNYFGDSLDVSILKAVYNYQVIDEIKLDTFLASYDYELTLADSIDLIGTKEIIVANIYYPACGYGNFYHYIDFDQKFRIITSQSSFVDVPYYSGFREYFLLKGTNKLTRFIGNKPYIEKGSKTNYYIVPKEFSDIPKNELFYIEYSMSMDSVKNGEPVVDKDGEYILNDVLYKKVLFRWKEQKIDTVYFWESKILNDL